MTDKIRSAGAKLSNIAYNLAQRGDLPADIIASLDISRKEWDAAVRAPSAPVANDERAKHDIADRLAMWLSASMDQHAAVDEMRKHIRAWLDYQPAALSVKAASTPEITEDWEAQREQLRAQYPGIDGEFKVFDVVITTELDCKLDEGEYGIDICELVNGCVGEHDFGRIKEAVSEVIDTLNLPDEGQTVVRVYESGEREDVFWNSYWRVVAPTPPTTGEA